MLVKWQALSLRFSSCLRYGGLEEICCKSNAFAQFSFLFMFDFNTRTWILVFGMAALIVAFWFIAEGEALRFLVLFIGVMSCLYVIWDVIGMLLFSSRSQILTHKRISDDTIARKVNSSDASAFAHICGCCPSQGRFLFRSFSDIPIDIKNDSVWGVFWLIIAFCFFVGGVLVGLVAFKVSCQHIYIRRDRWHRSM